MSKRITVTLTDEQAALLDKLTAIEDRAVQVFVGSGYKVKRGDLLRAWIAEKAKAIDITPETVVKDGTVYR